MLWREGAARSKSSAYPRLKMRGWGEEEQGQEGGNNGQGGGRATWERQGCRAVRRERHVAALEGGQRLRSRRGRLGLRSVLHQPLKSSASSNNSVRLCARAWNLGRVFVPAGIIVVCLQGEAAELLGHPRKLGQLAQDLS